MSVGQADSMCPCHAGGMNPSEEHGPLMAGLRSTTAPAVDGGVMKAQGGGDCTA